MDNKYILHVYTNWCGEDNEFAVITKNPESLAFTSFCDGIAYDNFESFDGFNQVLEDNFEANEDGNYTESEIEEAGGMEGDYYGWNLEEFEGDDEEWGWYGEPIWTDEE
jgi:hypothetical protein